MGIRLVNGRLIDMSRCLGQISWRAWLLFPLGIGLASDCMGSPVRIERSFEANRKPRVKIENLKGQIDVTGWDRPEIRLIYTGPETGMELEVEQFPGKGCVERLHITTRLGKPFATARERTADYVLKAPVGVLLQIHNEEGGVSVSKLEGEVSVDTAGAAIFVTEVAGHISVRSTTGDINITSAAGRVEAESIFGGLRFFSPMTYSVDGSTVSGSIIYEGDLMPTASCKLSTYSGRIDIGLPSVVSFELNAKSSHGKVQSDFPLALKRRSDSQAHGGNSLIGAHRAGEATVVLSSYRGDISIRRKD